MLCTEEEICQGYHYGGINFFMCYKMRPINHFQNQIKFYRTFIDLILKIDIIYDLMSILKLI